MTLMLRPATSDDARRLFDWRNDPETRANSIDTEPVRWNSHIAWFNSSLTAPRRQILIAEIDGVPVGTLRIDDTETGREMSWTVAPEARNQGNAAKIVKMGLKLGGPHAIAKIKPDNAKSRRVADQCGFVFDRMEDGLMVMKRGDQ